MPQSPRRRQSRRWRRPNAGDAEPAPMGHGRPFGAARWSGAGMREARRAPARSNGFGYFPRKESDPAVKAGTKRHSKHDSGYAHRQQPHRQRASRQWNPVHRFCCRFTADRDRGRSYGAADVPARSRASALLQTVWEGAKLATAACGAPPLTALFPGRIVKPPSSLPAPR